MNDLILKAYEFFSVMIPFGIIFFIRYHQKKQQNTKLYNALVFIFALYIYKVFFYTSAGTVYNVCQMGIDIRADQINIIPFSNNIDVVGYVLNILMFVPFGFLLLLIWPKTNNFITIVLFGFFFSLLIETSQLLNQRATDIDDLIMNTLGAVIGYLLFKLVLKILNCGNKFLSNNKVWEPLLYIFIMFVGRFLFFNELGMAKILYGF